MVAHAASAADGTAGGRDGGPHDGADGVGLRAGSRGGARRETACDPRGGPITATPGRRMAPGGRDRGAARSPPRPGDTALAHGGPNALGGQDRRTTRTETDVPSTAKFGRFLHADVGVQKDGVTAGVLSSLARLNLDPWREAERLAAMPRAVASPPGCRTTPDAGPPRMPGHRAAAAPAG